MIEIFLKMISYWIGMGIGVALVLYFCLKFAVICEKIADGFTQS